MIVLDASAMIELLLQTRIGLTVEERVISSAETLHAPHLLDVEVAQVLRRFVRAGSVTPVRGEQAMQDLIDLRIRRYPHSPFLQRVWGLRDNLSAYDALYVALAETLSATLLTCDVKLASAPRHRARIVLLR